MQRLDLGRLEGWIHSSIFVPARPEPGMAPSILTSRGPKRLIEVSIFDFRRLEWAIEASIFVFGRPDPKIEARST